MEKLEQLLAEIFEDDAPALSDDTPFVESPGWDSLKHVELIVGIETRFGVDLTADEIASIRTKAAARALLAAKGCL